MFKRLSYVFAAQFTIFVFIVLLLVGGIYLAFDYSTQRRAVDDMLARETSRVITHITNAPNLEQSSLTRRELNFIRLFNPDRSLRYQGGFFTSGGVPQSFPATNNPSFSDLKLDIATYRISTQRAYEKGQFIGFLQVAQEETATPETLAARALLYLFICSCISVITFILGLFLALRNLLPVRQSMERLEQFTQDASHELKTPLSVLSSSLDLALKTENYKEGLISAKEDLKHASELVDRLLELARLDRLSLNYTQIDVGQLLQDIAEKYQPLAEEKDIRLTVDVEHPLSLRADADLFQQAVVNLVTNALKFTPPSGTVTLELNRNRLEVRDTGIGIEAKDVEHIFDRFYQADSSRNGQGFGLGLALVQKIVELHHWHIKVQSVLGKGTVFAMSFPTHPPRRRAR